MTIFFYRTREPYGWLGNFSRHGFELKGKWWATVEHYYQAQKFAGTEHEELVRSSESPGEAARRGRDPARALRHDWEAVKDAVMLEAVTAKFNAHADLRRLLLETGDEDLVEKTSRDDYWGCGTSGTGKNKLGLILMEVRARASRGRSSSSG